MGSNFKQLHPRLTFKSIETNLFENFEISSSTDNLMQNQFETKQNLSFVFEMSQRN